MGRPAAAVTGPIRGSSSRGVALSLDLKIPPLRATDRRPPASLCCLAQNHAHCTHTASCRHSGGRLRLEAETRGRGRRAHGTDPAHRARGVAARPLVLDRQQRGAARHVSMTAGPRRAAVGPQSLPRWAHRETQDSYTKTQKRQPPRRIRKTPGPRPPSTSASPSARAVATRAGAPCRGPGRRPPLGSTP